jgi:DNA-binding CsgD family transcriptional regulator
LWIYYLKACVLKVIAETLSITKGSLRQYLVPIRRIFGVRTTRELICMLDTSSIVDRPVKLTPRGRQVFLRTAAGLTNREIAVQLGMSVSGVRRHKEKMLLQNDCDSMLRLIAKYYARSSAEQTGANNLPE